MKKPDDRKKDEKQKEEPFETTELDGAYSEPEDAKFKENVIQDIPEIRPQEHSKPISELYSRKKPTKKNPGLENRNENKVVAQRKATKRRRARNKQAKKARKKNRRK